MKMAESSQSDSLLAISPFPTVFFYPFGELSVIFSSNLKLSSANSFSLEESKICRLERVKIF